MPKAATYSDPEKIVTTPVMERLSEVTEIFELIRAALADVEKELRDPLAVLAWLEGHPVGHIMIQMHRKPQNNVTLYNILGRHGVDTRARVGTRKRDIVPQELPEHLKSTPEDVLELAEAARRVVEAREDEQAEAS